MDRKTIEALLKRQSDPGRRVETGIRRFGEILTTGKASTPVDEFADDTTSAYLKRKLVEQAVKPTRGYGSMEEVPTEQGGLPLYQTTIDEGGRIIPVYRRTPAIFDPTEGIYGEEQNEEPMELPEPVDIQPIAQPQATTDPLAELEAQKKDYLSRNPDADVAEVNRVFEEERSKLATATANPTVASTPTIEGDIAEFDDLSQEDYDYLIQQGFDPEIVKTAFDTAARKRTAK